VEIKLSKVQKDKLDVISFEINELTGIINQLRKKQSDILEIILDSHGISQNDLERNLELKDDCLIVELKDTLNK
jgi:hypothetical protein